MIDSVHTGIYQVYISLTDLQGLLSYNFLIELQAASFMQLSVLRSILETHLLLLHKFTYSQSTSHTTAMKTV